jgi:hypothetical protein
MKSILELIPAPKIEGCFLDELKARIIARIKQVSLDKPEYKQEVKCILFVCTMIESAILPAQKIDKRRFLLDIFKEVYGLSVVEEDAIKNIVDVLHLGKRIKRKSWYKLYCTSVMEAFRI